jgi:nuclease S1
MLSVRTVPNQSWRGLNRAAVVSMTLAIVAPSAMAWGRDGHRIVAAAAWFQLTPSARANVQKLLNQEAGASLESISTWADEARSPSTARWHYANIDRSASCRYEPARDCPDGQCVVSALRNQARQVQPGNAAEVRLKALKYLVHLVGDIHQPLHASFAEDKGGNLFQVQAFGKGSNLHSVWDSGLIETWASGVPDLTASVMKSFPQGSVAFEAERWAQESCTLVSQSWFYPTEHRIDEHYVELAKPIVRERLAIGARRLATLLNATFGEQ